MISFKLTFKPHALHPSVTLSYRLDSVYLFLHQSGGRGNVLAVGNCYYVAVCSAAQDTSAPTGWGVGRGHIVAVARLQLVVVATHVCKERAADQ